MTTGNTSLLGLALPVEGELDGTWGNVVNNSITSLVDSAVAGTTTLSTDADVTLTDTTLAANQARQAVLLWTASNGATTRNITAPARSKPYIVINAGTGSVVLRGAGPTTGVTVVSGEKCLAAWNSSDFVKISSSTADGVTSVGGTGTVNGITLTGTVTSTGNLTLGGTLSNVSLTTQVTGTLPVANGGTGVTTSTGTGSVVLSSSPSLTTPALGTPSSATLTNATGLPIDAGTTGTLPANRGGTGLTALGAGVATFLGTPSSANLASAVTDETGTGSLVFATSPTLVTPALGTPSSGTLTNTTGLPIDGGTTGTLPVNRGGTGATSLTANNVILGNGTSAVQVVAPGTSGNVLTSNGTTWTSAAAGASLSGVTDSGSPYETSLGYQAGNVNTGANNTFLGYVAGYYNTTGNQNTFIGNSAGASGTNDLTTGSNNIIIGYNAESSSSTVSNEVTIGNTSITKLRVPGLGVDWAVNDVPFRNIPQNSQSAAYTLVASDAGKHIFHPAADNNARTFTIPANGSVAYPIGTAITFINMSTANVTIAITTDTLTLSPAGTTGSRTLATNGSATCIKITATQWLISGSGLT